MYDTKCFVHTRRVRAYILNGWASNLIHPDAIPTPAVNEIQSLHPTDGWKSIWNTFTSPSEVPDFSTGNIITYFVSGTATDGLAVSDFNSMNKSAENLFLCGHVHDIEQNTDGDILCVRAKCRPEMRKDRIYKLILSLSDSYNIVSAKCGCPATQGWLGASPDGLVHDPASHDPSGILEIKCPCTKRYVSPEEACQDRDFHCTLEDGHIKLKKTHIYFHQVQLQLYGCSDLCIYLV